MPWSSTAILSVVELVIYILFFPLLAFSAYKHGKKGLFIHIYLLTFIILRVIADILSISDRDAPTGISKAGAVVNSIGLSPLLLATMAMLNESRSLVNSNLASKKEKRLRTTLEIVVHLIVVTGLALVAVGSANATKATSNFEVKKHHTLAEVGAIMLFLAWLISCLWAYATFRLSRCTHGKGPSYLILMAVVCALPFLGARVVYTVVYTFDHSRNLSPATAPFAIKLILLFLMQLAVATILEGGLLMSQNLVPGSQRPTDFGYRGSTDQVNSTVTGHKLVEDTNV